ncbi:hypothetical protein V1527DRAFT_467129 [Lipomyces starkeyi]
MSFDPGSIQIPTSSPTFIPSRRLHHITHTSPHHSLESSRHQTNKMHFTKPLLILAVGAPLIAAQSDPSSLVTFPNPADKAENITFPKPVEKAENLTFSDVTTPSISNATFTNMTSNATSPSPPEVAANHAAGTTAQNVAWFSVLVGGLCVFAFF